MFEVSWAAVLVAIRTFLLICSFFSSIVAVLSKQLTMHSKYNNKPPFLLSVKD